MQIELKAVTTMTEKFNIHFIVKKPDKGHPCVWKPIRLVMIEVKYFTNFGLYPGRPIGSIFPTILCLTSQNTYLSLKKNNNNKTNTAL
jgi:hypothetical protein